MTIKFIFEMASREKIPKLQKRSKRLGEWRDKKTPFLKGCFFTDGIE